MKHSPATLALLACAACTSGSFQAAADGPGGGGLDGPQVDAAAQVADVTPPHDLARPTGDPALLAIAGDLHGAFLELECVGEEIEFQFCMARNRAIDLPLHFGGEAGTRYAVTLKVWGVLEGILYAGGKALAENFYQGGQSTTPMTAVYGLTVGDQTYWFNHFEIGAGDHYTYGVTYETPPITIPGASTLTLFVHSPDDIINTNHMQNEVMDPTPALQDRLDAIHGEKLQGQFLYVEVTSAKLAP